ESFLHAILKLWLVEDRDARQVSEACGRTGEAAGLDWIQTARERLERHLTEPANATLLAAVSEPCFSQAEQAGLDALLDGTLAEPYARVLYRLIVCCPSWKHAFAEAFVKRAADRGRPGGTGRPSRMAGRHGGLPARPLFEQREEQQRKMGNAGDRP